jgi:hypothetical protein
MNTNFAQILVSNLKMSSSRFKVGMMSLVFTFVFLGMGTTSHAQSLMKSDAKVDASILENYSFKTETSFVMDVLRSELEDLSSPDGDEVYKTLKNHFIMTIVSNVDRNNGDVRQAVQIAYVDLVHFAERFKNPDGKIVEVVTEVSALIN